MILNIYHHHLDVVLTMRPIDGMWGDMGNINGNPSNLEGENMGRLVIQMMQEGMGKLCQNERKVRRGLHYLDELETNRKCFTILAI